MLAIVVGRYRFSARVWPSLAAAAGVALTLALGNWQLQRAAEKIRLHERIELLAREPPVQIATEPADVAQLAYRRVEARGSFVPQHMILLDNKVRHGVAGFEVVMPLKLGAGAMHVLVDRGWIAGTGDRSRLPEVATPAGTLTVTGLAVVPSPRYLELSNQTIEGKVWQNLVLDRYRRATGLAVQPIVIEQDGALDDGLLREWPLPDSGAARHQGYAFQWFCLAALIAVLYVVLNCQREPGETKAD